MIISAENAASSAAPDPELEDYYCAVKTTAKPVSTNTPLAAWVLLTLFMLSYIQQNAASNVIGEIFSSMLQALSIDLNAQYHTLEE